MTGPRVMCSACGEVEIGIFSPFCPQCETAIAADIRGNCHHLWSAPDESGTKWCAWCGAKTGVGALGVQP